MRAIRFLVVTLFSASLLLNPRSVFGDTCPPCPINADTDTCVLTCCYFQNCETPAGVVCVALCDFGFVLDQIFNAPDRLAPAFVTKPLADAQTSGCELARRLGGVIELTEPGTTQKLELSAYNLRTDKFDGAGLRQAKVTFYMMPLSPRARYADVSSWKRLGEGTYDGQRRSWFLNWDKSHLQRDKGYLLRAEIAYPNQSRATAFAFASYLVNSQTTAPNLQTKPV